MSEILMQGLINGLRTGFVVLMYGLKLVSMAVAPFFEERR